MTMLSPLRRWWFVVAFQLLLACTWHPRYGRASTTATAQTTSRDSIEADAGVMTNGSKRILQKTTPRPSTRRPTSPTRNPTNKPTTRNPTSTPTRMPTSFPTAKPSPVPSSMPTTQPTTAKPTTTPTFTPSTSSPTTNPTAAGPLSCPRLHCANDVVTTTVPIPGGSCPGLVATTLATFVYQGDVLVELTGPSDPAHAADLIITAPHGGSKTPTYMPNRQTSGPFCPADGCAIDKDTNSLEIAVSLQGKFISNYCRVPYLVINHLHRIKLDANREVLEAAQNDTIAVDAWFNFHNFTNVAQLAVRSKFGTMTNSAGITGARALLFDVHGYAGLDWVPVDGSPLVQWGYRLSAAETLNPDLYCPIDLRTGTIGSLTHARDLPGPTYECLVRGPGSLASRVSNMIDAMGGLTNDAHCGHGTPSYENESPWALAHDPGHCNQVIGNPANECHYYSGGYDIEVHERMNWQDLSGEHFNAVQAELPRCIRFGGADVRDKFADILSTAVMSFMRDLYD